MKCIDINRTTRSFAMAVLISFMLPLSVAHATEVYQGDESFLFKLGYFFPAFDTKMRVQDGSGGRGDDVNLEDDLGFSHNETTIWGEANWRMTPRNRLSLGFFRFNRGGDRTAQKDITIGDETYPAGAELHSTIDLSVIPISYSYSFIKTDTWEFAGTAGLQWSVINFNVTGSASLGNKDLDKEAKAESNAPLPLIGMDLTYNFSPEWSLGGNVAAFVYKVATGNMTFQGTIYNATVNGDWWFANNYGAGIAVNWFSFNVTVDDPRWTGALNYQYLGPQIYLQGRF